MCRADRELPEGLKRKISLMCDVDAEAVVAAVDAPSIYEIPKVLHAEGLDAYVVRRLGLPFRDVDWTVWGDLLDRVHHPRAEVTVALVGKYIDLPDAYLSVSEALRAAAFAHRAHVTIRWVASDDCETPAGAAAHLAGVDAIVIPGGFGIRGIEGKVGALRHARERSIPALGPVPRPAVHGDRGRAQPRRPGRCELGRVRPRHPASGDRHDGRPGGDRVRRGRHGRHDAARRLPGDAQGGLGGGRGVRRDVGVGAASAPLRGEQLLPRRSSSESGLVISGTSPDGRLVEFVELPRTVHPFYAGTQAHPELKSRPTRAHPLFRGLIGAALKYSDAERLPVQIHDDGEHTHNGVAVAATSVTR